MVRGLTDVLLFKFDAFRVRSLSHHKDMLRRRYGCGGADEYSKLIPSGPDRDGIYRADRKARRKDAAVPCRDNGLACFDGFRLDD